MIDRQGKPWTDTERMVLRETWGQLPIWEVAESLHRTIGGVRQRAKIEGLQLGAAAERGGQREV